MQLLSYVKTVAHNKNTTAFDQKHRPIQPHFWSLSPDRLAICSLPGLLPEKYHRRHLNLIAARVCLNDRNSLLQQAIPPLFCLFKLDKNFMYLNGGKNVSISVLWQKHLNVTQHSEHRQMEVFEMRCFGNLLNLGGRVRNISWQNGQGRVMLDK